MSMGNILWNIVSPTKQCYDAWIHPPSSYQILVWKFPPTKSSIPFSMSNDYWFPMVCTQAPPPTSLHGILLSINDLIYSLHELNPCYHWSRIVSYTHLAKWPPRGHLESLWLAGILNIQLGKSTHVIFPASCFYDCIDYPNLCVLLFWVMQCNDVLLKMFKFY